MSLHYPSQVLFHVIWVACSVRAGRINSHICSWSLLMAKQILPIIEIKAPINSEYPTAAPFLPSRWRGDHESDGKMLTQAKFFDIFFIALFYFLPGDVQIEHTFLSYKATASESGNDSRFSLSLGITTIIRKILTDFWTSYTWIERMVKSLQSRTDSTQAF